MDCDDCRDAELYARHYLLDAVGGARVLWKLFDHVLECPWDLYAGFLPGSLSLTDLDRDGVAETAFLYTLSCRSDYSPAGRKLILHEGATKYAMRGTTRLADGQGGEMRSDATLAADPYFSAFAQQQWNRYAAVDGFAQLDLPPPRHGPPAGQSRQR